MAHATIQLQAPDEFQFPEWETQSSATGSFQFKAVRSGIWRVRAFKPPEVDGPEGYSALIVDKQDVPNLTIQMVLPFSLVGIVEREDFPGVAGLGTITPIALVPVDGQGKRALSGHDKNGRFEFKTVIPGRYIIAPLGYLAGYYVESVKLDNVEVMAKPI